MTFLTRLGRRWVAPLAAAGLLAGCQSSRPAFLFQPAAPYLPAAPLRATAALPATVAAPTAPVGAASTPAALAAAPSTLGAPPALRRALRRLATRPLPRPAGPALGSGGAGPAVVAAAPVEVVPRRPHRLRLAPAHTAESGLGRVVLFVLLVALGVLAGLGALVSLIPGVSFWGGLGLAAAGLLVLFLLYSLLSGGKKK